MLDYQKKQMFIQLCYLVSETTFASAVSEKYGFELTVVEQTTIMYEMVKNGEVDGCFEDIPVVGY